MLYGADAGRRAERALIDPMAIDPTGQTTLDPWQPDKEGRLLAYQLSEGGNEESLLRVIDVGTGRGRRRPDRPVPLLRGRLAAGRQGVLLRPAAAAGGGARRARRSTTGGSTCTWWAPPPETDTLVFGEGRDKTTYYGVSVSRTAAG